MDPPLRVKVEYSVLGKKKKREVQKVIQDLADFSDSSDDGSTNPQMPVTSTRNQANNTVQQKSNQPEESVGKSKDICSAISRLCHTAKERPYKTLSAIVTHKLKHKDFLYAVCSNGKENVLSLNQDCEKEMKRSKHSALQEGLNEKNKIVETEMKDEIDPKFRHLVKQGPEDGCPVTATSDNKNRLAESQRMKITDCVKKQAEKGTASNALPPKSKPKSRKGKPAANRTLADLGINFDFSDGSDSEVTEKPAKGNSNRQLLTPSETKLPCSSNTNKECKLKIQSKTEASTDKLNVECDHHPEKLPPYLSKHFPREVISTSVGKVCMPLAWPNSLNDGQIIKTESEMTDGVETCSRGPCTTRTSTPCHLDTEHRVSGRYHLSVSEIRANYKFKPCVSDSRNECEIDLTQAKSVFNTNTMSCYGACSSDTGLAEESMLAFLESMPANLLESTSCDPKQNFRLYLANEWNKVEPQENADQDSSSKKKYNFFQKSEEDSPASLSKSDNEIPQATDISNGMQEEKNKFNDGGSSKIRNISGEKVLSLSEELQSPSVGEMKNETESQYETCQSSAENISFYEAVDVSTQTSFLWETTKCKDDLKHMDVDEFEKELKHNDTDGSLEFRDAQRDINKVRQTEVPVFNRSGTLSDSALYMYIATEGDDYKDVRNITTSENLDESWQEHQTATRRKSFQKQGLEETGQLVSDSDITRSENGTSGLLDVQKKVSTASNHSPGIIIPFGSDTLSDILGDEKAAAAIHSTDGSQINELGCRSGMQETNDSFAPSRTDAENSENIRTRNSGWRQRKDVSSSDEDADEHLEAFFKKHRPQVEQTTYSESDNDYDDMDNFIVNDSDVSESEEECYPHLRDLEFSEPLPGKYEPKDTKKVGNCLYSDMVTSSDSECSEDDGKREFIHKDIHTSSEECDEVFLTPLPVIKSKSGRTPSDKVRSPQWFTPATSKKSKSGDVRAGKNFPKEAAKTGSTISRIPPTHNAACNQTGVARHLSFLHSLSAETPDSLRHPEAKSLVSHFRKQREELSSRLFKLFNSTVFENKLPDNMQIIWNKRLLKTAGRCRQKRVGGQHHACIELSLKVCDTPERVRDTLIHEMCHAAVWLVNERNEGHGPLWRYWAHRANKSHPEIPVIGRCHDYKISTKYIYKCNKCGQQVGRHSKSLDTSRFICGRCGGRFQLLVASELGDSSRSGQTPRTPSRFAMFVKENYGSIKKGNKDISHKEIMNILSKDFSEKNKI